MDSFTKKTLTTPRGYTYTYYTSPGGSPSLPALFFQHGFPDHAHMWSPLISHLPSPFPYRIIVPDMLGYAGSSKPTSPSAYAWPGVTSDLVSILDAEAVDKCISIGHDWGSTIAAHLYLYHPERVAGCVFVNVPYAGPARTRFSIDAVNAVAQARFGIPIYAYWHFFTAPDAPAILAQRAQRMYETMHCTGSLARFFCVPGRLREHLVGEEGLEKTRVREYATGEEAKREFVKRMERDGWEAPLCWYRAQTLLQHHTDRLLPFDRDIITRPVLYFGGKHDPICRPENMTPAIEKGLLPDLEMREQLDAGHWSPLEQPKQAARYIEEWLGRKFGDGGEHPRSIAAVL